MFEKYPKKRQPLPEAYQQIYFNHYKKNRAGAGLTYSLSRYMEGWLHRKVAADVRPSDAKSTLEIGAGTLNHLEYESSPAYDVVEPLHEFYNDSPHRSQVRKFFDSINEIPPATRYDRIISIATFEHVTDLPRVVAHACLLLEEGGVLRTSIPNEGHWLWRLSYMLTTGLEFRLRFGLNYNVFMQHEHVNTAEEIEEVLNYFFGKTRCSVFGISRRLCLYRYYECTQAQKAKARVYLQTTATGGL